MSLRLKHWGILAGVATFSSLALWVVVGAKTVYQNFDGPYYLVVAKSWYNPDIIGKNFSFSLPLEYYPAHFPLYPTLITLAATTGLTPPQAMVAVNLLASVTAAIVFYEIARESKWSQPLILALVWLFWWPRMWVVRSIGSPETLFILGLMLSLFFFAQGRYWLSGVAGAAATLTKSPGILLFAAYGLSTVADYIRTRRINWKIYPVLLIPLALVGLFGFFYLRTGDFWAYWHTGDNIHLLPWPFGIFNSDQYWVGSWWLEDVLWIYLIGAIGVWLAFKKYPVWGWFGAVFYTTLLFVAHRDISRYSLPLVPIVLSGISSLFNQKAIRWILVLLIVPLFFYSLNFLSHNTVDIANWGPFL